MYLEKYEIPKKIFFLDNFQLTISGKVKRKEMMDLIKNNISNIRTKDGSPETEHNVKFKFKNL